MSGDFVYDAYFDAVTDTVGEAQAIDEGFSNAVALLREAVGADGASIEAIVAAFDARMRVDTDDTYSIAVLQARCEVSTDVVLRSFAACETREFEADNPASCNGACRSTDTRCKPDEIVVCNGTIPNLICPGECRGECTAGGDAGVCLGRCEGTCVGSCSVIVDGEPCAGTCFGSERDGACQGVCELDFRDGSPCDGTCSGTCDDNCRASVDSDGVCSGLCLGQCTYSPRDGHCFDTLAECSTSDGSIDCAGTCIGDVSPPSGLLPCELVASAANKVQAMCSTPFVTIDYIPLETLTPQEGARLEAFVMTFRDALGNLLSYEARAENAGSALEELGGAAPALAEDVERAFDETPYDLLSRRAGLLCAKDGLVVIPELIADQGDLRAVSVTLAQLRGELGIPR